MTDLIGASIPRPDALGKVTGGARYPADLIQPGMLRLKVVFAHRPHAKILAIDTSAAMAVPGVVAVFTATDVPCNVYGLIEPDQPALCREKVRFEGDKVALVVAESQEAAEAAAALVSVEYEDLPAVTAPRAAMAADAPLVHEAKGSNILLHRPLRKGNIEAGFTAADVVLGEEFHTSWQEHAFLQPEAGIAFMDDDGRLIIESAGQWLHEDRRQIAEMLRLPQDQVVIRYAAIGGAFGGREDLSMQHLLALAAWKLRRPVAMTWSREESMIAHHKRHPMTIQTRWGVTRDGKITAVAAEIVADGGAYASTSVEVLKVAVLFASGCYEVENIAVDGYAVYTNNIPCGAFRGFGAPQAQFAAEIMVSRLADAIGMDRMELRRRNIYREGSIEPTQHPLPAGVSALPVLERCLEEVRGRWQLGEIGENSFGPGRQEPNAPASHPGMHSRAHPRKSAEAGWEIDSGSEAAAADFCHSVRELSPGRERHEHLRRGIGIACGMKNVGYSFGFPEQATATVELFGRGEIERATVRIGAADVGQGSHLALRQIAAETLHLPIDFVDMVTDDSAEAPNAGSASASRMTFVGGRAVRDAAAAAIARWPDTDDLHLEETVQYQPPATTPLQADTGIGIPNYCYGYVAQAVEVEVNTLTGQVRVLRVISVHDVGKAINRQQVEGQIEGCLAQAVGYALLENFQVRNGRVLTPYFSTYLLPTALDMPEEIVPVILELADPLGPYGARGVAEMALVPFAPAVAAAIHDAVGIWLTELPMIPERVLAALHGSFRPKPTRHSDAEGEAPVLVVKTPPPGNARVGPGGASH